MISYTRTMYTPSDSVRKLVEEGAECMAKKQWENAVDAYSEACQVYNLENGDDSGELLVMYAKALIENGIKNNDVIAGETGEEGGEGDEEDDEEEEEEEEGKFQFFNGVAEKDGEVEEVEKEEVKEEEVKEEAEIDDGPNDFEIAMEILEVAKEQFIKHDNKIQIANVYVLQGDIYLETDQGIESMKSYQEAVNILRDEKDDIKLAETLVMLSISQELNGELENAIKSMKECISLGKEWKRKGEMEVRLDELSNRLTIEEKEKEKMKEMAKRVVESNDLTSLVKRRKK